MSGESSPKYYQKTTKRIKESLAKDIKVLMMKKKIKSENMAMNYIRISHNMKSKG